MAKMFVKGTVINPSTKEENTTEDKGAIYKPALKLINKQSVTAPTTPQEQKIKPPLTGSSLKKELSINDEAAVAALAEQERSRKRAAEEKKKSNLELFKEELKRFFKFQKIFY